MNDALPTRHHVHVRLTDPFGVAYRGARLSLHLVTPHHGPDGRIASYRVVPECRTFVTNISGYARLDLLPNEDLQPGSRYQLDILTLHGTQRRQFVIKRTDATDLEWADLAPLNEHAAPCENYLERTWN